MIEIDDCHIVLIEGLIRSSKPETVLELGIGTGKTTQAIMRGLLANQKGKLVSVDSWHDWGTRPSHIDGLQEMGANVIESTEETFMTNCPADAYDFVISDADHHRAHEWVGENFRITRNGGIMVWHDVTNADFPALKKITEAVRNRHLNHMLFTSSSVAGEECWRGLLVATNAKNDS